MSEWRIIGAISGGMAAFAIMFAIAFAVTGGSAWMLLFFPLIFAAPGSVIMLVMRGGDQ